MQTNKKVLTIVFLMLGLLSIAIISNVWFQFIEFGKKVTIEKANSIAESVRDGLTAHMTLHAMDKKDVFLRNMISHQNVKTLRIVRSKENMQELNNTKIEYASYDQIEKDVLKTGKPISRVHEDFLRITIPYIAYSNSNPDCISCHVNVSDGDVLGAITLELITDEVKTVTMTTILMIIGISLIFLVLAFFTTSYFIRPYVKLFDDLEEGIAKAYKGDFSHQVTTKLSNDAGKVAKRLNDLSEIFRFKKTIELDYDKAIIYERIAYILENNFKIKQFLIFENNVITKKRKIVFKSNSMIDINEHNLEQSKETCRAFRTNTQVSSKDFHKVCKLCYHKDKESICLPFTIGEELILTLLIYTDTLDELVRIKKLIPIISNYFELTEPVLQTKILMDKLQENSLTDPMTGLFNRRYLDNYIESGIKEDDSFSVMMIDIDFFKQVNDTYGHDIGDEVIKNLAEVLKNNIKGSDIAMRFGGEEFVLITYNTSHAIATKIANAIREDFSKKIFKANGESFSKTLSVGIANFPQDSDSPWQCIKFSDVALYEAKNSGRNKVVMFKHEMYKEETI